MQFFCVKKEHLYLSRSELKSDTETLKILPVQQYNLQLRVHFACTSSSRFTASSCGCGQMLTLLFFFLYTYKYKLFLLFTAKALAQLAEHQTGVLTEQKFPFMKNLNPKSALDSSCCGLVRSLFSCKVCKHVVDAGGNTQTWCTNSVEEQV